MTPAASAATPDTAHLHMLTLALACTGRQADRQKTDRQAGRHAADSMAANDNYRNAKGVQAKVDVYFCHHCAEPTIYGIPTQTRDHLELDGSEQSLHCV